MTLIASALYSTIRLLLFSILAYVGFLSILTIPALQTHIIYLHRVTLICFQDVNFPMQWGFLPNQVTPFSLDTPDGEVLHAWHILPLGLYAQHAAVLTAEPTGLAPNITGHLSFKLLRDDPQSLLVLYLHGAAGTVVSGWRPASYRAIHALAPERIHTVAIDYRGFGTSTGAPTEEGLLTDALTLARWAMHGARIPSERIVIFAQSMGTAVALSLMHHLATAEPNPVFFKGAVLVAPFADSAELSSTYSIAGSVPLLGPLARFPALHELFKSFLICKWPSRDKLAEFVKVAGETRGARYDVSIIHAMDDWDVPWSHSEKLFWHAVGASIEEGESVEKVRVNIEREKRPMGEGGWVRQRRTSHGVLRQEIVEYGLHDRIMAYPIVSMAVWRAFGIDR